MVILVVSTQVKEGRRDDFINLFKAFAEIVRKEKGCIEYFPAIDLESDFGPQVKDPNTVTVLEKWASMQALTDHLGTADMKTFAEKSKEMVAGMSAKVLQYA